MLAKELLLEEFRGVSKGGALVLAKEVLLEEFRGVSKGGPLGRV